MSVRACLVSFAALTVAACQPAVPVQPLASAPSPAGETAAAAAPAALAFAALTADQIAFLRRRPGHDPYHNAAGAVVAGWDAPPETRSGNWAYHLHVPERAVSEGEAQAAEPTFTAAFAGIDAAEVPLALTADPAATYERLAAGWAADARPAAAETPVAARRYDAELPILPAPEVKGTPAPLPTAFVSQARGETLAFYREGARVVALRVRWAAAPGAAEAKVDAAQAVAALRSAIAAPEGTSVEAETGLDWFVGLPFRNGDALPVGCLTLSPGVGETLRVEPELAATFVAPILERRFGKLVWRVNEADVGPSCRVGPSLETVFDRTRGSGFVRVHGAGGYVDAETGRVVRFRRNYRVYGVQGMSQPLAMFPGS